MKTRCNCYACRNYFDGCEEKTHPERIRVKHWDGSFWWGDPKEHNGVWVMICLPCKKALQES